MATTSGAGYQTFIYLQRQSICSDPVKRLKNTPSFQMGFKTAGIKTNLALEQVSKLLLTKPPTNPNILNDPQPQVVTEHRDRRRSNAGERHRKQTAPRQDVLGRAAAADRRVSVASTAISRREDKLLAVTRPAGEASSALPPPVFRYNRRRRPLVTSVWIQANRPESRRGESGRSCSSVQPPNFRSTQPHPQSLSHFPCSRTLTSRTDDRLQISRIDSHSGEGCLVPALRVSAAANFLSPPAAVFFSCGCFCPWHRSGRISTVPP